MLVVTAELLHGTIRLTSAADVALTGQAETAEWPPSPARLFAALVAADRTGERCRVTDGTELQVLESAPPPVVHADAHGDVLHSDLRPRFVVLNERAKQSSVQEYVARSAGVVRPGTRSAPRDPVITYVWPDLVVGEPMLAALRMRASRVGYLGCSDSPVRITVSTDPPSGLADSWEPDPRGTATLPVTFPGLLGALDSMYAQFSAGEYPRRAWFANRLERYRPPGPVQNTPLRPTIVWLRFANAIPGRRVVTVTDALRAALLDRYVPRPGDGGEDDPNGVPAVLHGHGLSGSGYLTACYLALPDVGSPRSRGRIHGAAVVLPPGASPELVEGVRSALGGVHVLERPGVFRTESRLYGGERRPWAAAPDRWSAAPCRTWVSAFPVVHERHRRGGPNLADVALWSEHAGLPQPIAFKASRVPLLSGAVSLMPHEVFRDSGARGPYSHAAVKFEEPVAGPFALGRGRQFGLGLMAPLYDDQP